MFLIELNINRHINLMHSIWNILSRILTNIKPGFDFTSASILPVNQLLMQVAVKMSKDESFHQNGFKAYS